MGSHADHWAGPFCVHPCRLNLGVAQLLEKNLEYLNDCLDDVMVEQVGWAAGWPAIQGVWVGLLPRRDVCRRKGGPVLRLPHAAQQ